MAVSYGNPTEETKGEEYLDEQLRENLHGDFETYVQPFFQKVGGGVEYDDNLHGYTPDLLILSNNGITIVEVKDWILSKYSKNNQGEIIKKDNNQKMPSPVYQLKRYQKKLAQYAHLDRNKINIFLYFHNARTESARNFIGNECLIFGNDAIDEIIQNVSSHLSGDFKREEINRVKNLIKPKKHQVDQNLSFTEQLTALQKRWSRHQPKEETQKHNWHRVYGVAGSGKTLVIAQRAANIAAANLRVLVVCFNNTLKNYISYLTRKSPKEFDTRFIKITTFHSFLFDFVRTKHYETIVGENPQERINKAFFLANTYLNEFALMDDEKYDAILIDEAQDFEKEWFDFLTHFLTENDEILAVVDDKQNVYNKSLSWIKTGFKGKWGKLDRNFRSAFAPGMILEAKRFSDDFLQGYLENNSNEKSLNFEFPIEELEKAKEEINKGVFLQRPSNYWKNCYGFNLVEMVLSAYYFLKKIGNFEDKDIAILIPKGITKEWKYGIYRSFESRGIKMNPAIEDQQKKLFDFEADGLKYLFVNSFKGLEAKAIIYLVSRDTYINDIEKHMLTYVALTRTKEYCIILNYAEVYKDYGKEWPQLDDYLK